MLFTYSIYLFIIILLLLPISPVGYLGSLIDGTSLLVVEAVLFEVAALTYNYAGKCIISIYTNLAILLMQLVAQC